MRALILLMVVGGMLPVALVRPDVGLLAYLWFGLMSIDQYAFVSGQYPISLAMAAATIAGILIRHSNFIFVLATNPFTVALIATCLSMGPSVFLGIDNTTTLEPYLLYCRVVLMVLFIPVVIGSLKQLRYLLLMLIGSIGLVGAKVGLGGLVRGGARYSNGFGYGPFVDSNFLALGFAMAVPLSWYTSNLLDRGWQRNALRAIAALNVCGVVWTYSRGAALSTGAVFLLMALHSKHRLAVLAFLAVISGAAIGLVRESYLERLSTIQAPTEEGSARSRLEYAGIAVQMWKDHPFGVGFGTFNFRKELSKYLDRDAEQVVHNTYLQILVDSGPIPFILHIALVVGSIIWLLKSARRIVKTHPGLENYPLALGISLVAFMVGSTFLSIVKFELYHCVLMAAAAWYGCEKRVLYQHQMMAVAERNVLAARQHAEVGVREPGLGYARSHMLPPFD